MDLSREEIVDLAHRYVPDGEVTDFPYNGDLFCLLVRQLPTDHVPAEEEGWAFNGYGVCLSYSFDEETKPRGKWLWMHFASLSSFPPVSQVLKLQPPHVVRGRFQSVDRTREIRLLKVAMVGDDTKHALPEVAEKPANTHDRQPSSKSTEPAKNIVAFRKKKNS
ncbi:MAG: hypothetical protein JW863_09340 [Chitinispirillaceae bacterium]|nr:hypothetical protein [Chitinispirillaceae bacterium]